MKKITAALFAVLATLSFAGCSNTNRFMKDSEIKDITENPTGSITLSYQTSQDEEDTKTLTLDFVLYYEKAPIAVTNFIKLVKSSFYNNTYVNSFSVSEDNAYLNVEAYEYDEDDPDTTSYDESTNKVAKTLDYYIKGEFSENGWDKNDLKHEFGVFSMIRDTGYDTANGKFMICLDKLSSRDGYYTSFGKLKQVNTNTLLNDLKVMSANGISPASYDFRIVSITVDTKNVDFGDPLKIKK